MSPLTYVWPIGHVCSAELSTIISSSVTENGVPVQDTVAKSFGANVRVQYSVNIGIKYKDRFFILQPFFLNEMIIMYMAYLVF